MEKQKLADLVMQKMKEKKELEERSRPHYEVLRLEATFAKELNDCLKMEIGQLETLLAGEESRLLELQNHLNELDNSGKKSFPRIVVKPEFIASEHILPHIKEFYRKTGNSFLRADILRHKAYEESIEREKQLLETLAQVRSLQETIRNNLNEDRKILNDKRTKVLKEDLRLRAIREEQRQIKQTIDEQRENNRDLLREYEIKKLNLQNRKDRLSYVTEQIEVYKKMIEEKFNPVSYRQHLKNVFAVEIKNEIMQKNLAQASKRVSKIQKATEKYERFLEKTNSLVVIGRTHDSPAAKRGKIQKRLQQQRKSSLTSKSHTRQFSLGSMGQSNSKSRAFSPAPASMTKSKIELDLTKVANNSTKTSLKTTDRSHFQQKSDISKQLF